MIWFTLALFLVSFIATVLLAPKPEFENARAGKLGDIQWPTASEGSPVPVVFGRVRLRNPNVIWYGQFGTQAIKKKVKTGVFSSEKVTTGHRYYVGFDLALCCGPDARLYKIWVDKKLLWGSIGVGPGASFISINKPNFFGGSERGGGFSGGCTFYSGEFTQARNSYLEGAVDPDVPGYAGTAHVVFHRPYIGTAPQLRPMSFEVGRYPNNLGLSPEDRILGVDLNPMEILYSVLTEEWGGINANPDDIDTDSWLAAGVILASENNGMSLLVSSANSGKSIAEEVLRQVDGILYQDPATGKIKVKLIREDYNVEELLAFDDTNLAGVEDFSRTSWAETINQVRVRFTNRAKKYEVATAFTQDMSNINMQGRVRSATYTFPACMKGSLAIALATRQLSQISVPLFRATLLANREAMQLRPGDPFLWSWPEFGLSQVVMRLLRFNTGTLPQGQITMEVIQDQFAANNVLYEIEDSAWLEEERAAAPITESLVFESPYWILQQLAWLVDLQDSMSYLWGLARNPGSMQSYELAVSNDAFENDVVAALDQPNFPPSALLMTDVPAQQGQPTGRIDKLLIQGVQPRPLEFPGYWNADFALGKIAHLDDIREQGMNLLIINNEIFAYEDYLDLGSNQYELLGVYRALLDTQYGDHVEDDVVWFLVGADWLAYRDPRPDTQLLYYRFLSYSDQDGQSLEDVVDSEFQLNRRYDRPLSPDRLMLEGVRCPIEIIGLGAFNITSLVERNRTHEDIQLISDSTTSPEAGTTYTVRFLLNGILVVEQTGLSYGSLPFSLSGLTGAGIGRIEVEATVAGLGSWAADFVEFWFANYLNLSAELVIDGRFEATFPGSWSTMLGIWGAEVTGYPLDPVVGIGTTSDTKHAETRVGSAFELRQDITVTSYQGHAAIFRLWRGRILSEAQTGVTLELRDAVGIVSSLEIPPSSSPWGKWDMLEFAAPISSSVTTARIRLLGQGPGATFDNVSLRANTASVPTAEKYDNLSGLTALGAWGLRQMISGYAGPLIRIRDVHNDSEFDVEQDEDGNLGLFWTRGEARVARLYDQSGNGSHLEAPTAETQPRLRYGLTPTGRPQIKFAAEEHLRDITTPGTTLPYMVSRPNMSMVIGPRDTEGNSYVATIPHFDASHSTPFYRWGMTTGSNDWRYRFDENSRSSAGNGDPDDTQSVFFADAQGGALYHNDDAVAVDSWTPADTTYPNATRLRIALSAGGTLPWDGEFYELCIFSGTISNVDRETLMNELGAYWFNV